MSRIHRGAKAIGVFIGFVFIGVPMGLCYMITGFMLWWTPMGTDIHNWAWNIKGGKRQPWRQFWADTKQRHFERKAHGDMVKTANRLTQQMKDRSR